MDLGMIQMDFRMIWMIYRGFQEENKMEELWKVNGNIMEQLWKHLYMYMYMYMYMYIYIYG